MNAAASDLPARSSAGMAALDVFYSDFNDVNIYVEDNEQENPTSRYLGSSSRA